MVETKTPLGLRQRYETELRENLKVELGLPNTMQVPKLVKVVVIWALVKQPSSQRFLMGHWLTWN